MSLRKNPTTLVPVLGLVLGLLVGGERPVSAAPLDFEGLDAACNATDPSTGTVPNGYGLLQWAQYSASTDVSTAVEVECDANFQGAYGNSYGSPSGSYAAYNGQGFGEINASIDGTFTFNGASFSTFANVDDFDVYSAYSLAILGYQPGDAIADYETAFDLSSTQYDFFAADWPGLNLLVFLVGDGLFDDTATIFGGDGRVFLMDDVNVTNVVPEPGSVFLLGAGLMAVVSALKRRRPKRLETRH